MRLRYSISLWNFTHYVFAPSLERLISGIRDLGFGVELWGRGSGEDDLYDEIGRRRLKPVLQGMPISLHTAGAAITFEGHQKQIDAAADWGAEMIVLHPSNLSRNGELDVDLACRVVEAASDAGVKISLENGSLDFLTNAIRQVPNLGICLDTGHVYLKGGSLAEYLPPLQHRLTHLHLQDIVHPAEKTLAMSHPDHYLPGTGGIPPHDWRLLASVLREIDYDGLAVFEIRPPSPFQLALRARPFIEALL